MKICPKCKTSHTKSGTFCCRKCANSRVWTSEVNKKRSNTAKKSLKVRAAVKKMSDAYFTYIEKGGTVGRKHIKRKKIKCPTCGTIFVKPDTSKQIFCTKSCRAKAINRTCFTGKRSQPEKYLEQALSKKFPHLVIHYNDREILNGLELDVYIPSINVAIEWNGIFHYLDIREGHLEKQIKKDALKKELCNEKGIKLIVVKDTTSKPAFVIQETEKIIEQIYILQSRSSAERTHA